MVNTKPIEDLWHHSPSNETLETEFTSGNQVHYNSSLTMTPTTNRGLNHGPSLATVTRSHGLRDSMSMRTSSYQPKNHLQDVVYVTPSLRWTGAMAFIGFIIGGILNQYDHLSYMKIVATWIGQGGRLYMSLLECFTLPLIFTSVSICIAHLITSNKTREVMTRMLTFFFIASLLAAITGLIISFCFSSVYTVTDTPPTISITTPLKLQCPNYKYLTATGCNGELLRDALEFTGTNITGIELSNTVDRPEVGVSFAKQIVDIFYRAFTSNIAEAFASGQSELTGVIIFAIFIGSGIIVAYDKSQGEENHAYILIKQLDLVLETIMNWLITWLPFGTLSSMIYSIAVGTMTKKRFAQAMFLPISFLVGVILYFLCVACVGYYLLVRKNPFLFFRHLMPALLFIFATGDTLATIPVMMRSIESSKQVSRTLSTFSLCIGSCICLCGTALYFVIACLFMVFADNLGDSLTIWRILLLVLLSTVSSMGTPHTEGASLTYVATIWTATFQTAPPSSFVYLSMMDWIHVRLRRVLNIAMTALITRIIAEQVDETAEDEDDRNNMDVNGRLRGAI